MRVKKRCKSCSGGGFVNHGFLGASIECQSCGGSGVSWFFERDPEVACGNCGEAFREGSEEAEFIGLHGMCAMCEFNGDEGL